MCIRFTCIVFIFGIFSISCNNTRETAGTNSLEVDSLFKEWGPDAPGVAVAILKDSSVLFQKGFGMANLEYSIPITSSSVFDIASLSKQFCAFAIALLAHEERLSLDDNIRIYIPELPDFGHDITIRHLIHHTSGLRDWPATLALAGWQMEDVISFKQIITMVKNQKELNFAPGTEYSYSNTGYNLLSEIVNRITGQSFNEWTKENIFMPLSMNSTHFCHDHQCIKKNRAQGYTWRDSSYIALSNNLTAMGSSSLHTTLEDLIKWIVNFQTGKTGGKEVLALMEDQGVLKHGDTISYAFGQHVESYKGTMRFQHTGAWAGFRTILSRFPEKGLSIVLLSNIGSFDATGMANKLADIFLQEEQEQNVEVSEKARTITVPENLLRRFEGYYRLKDGAIVDVYIKEQKLFFRHDIRPSGNESFPLLAISNSSFTSPTNGARIFFHDDKSREHASGLSLALSGVTRDGIFINFYDPSTTDLGEFSGKYSSDELHTEYFISTQSGILVVEHHRNEEIMLAPLAEDLFVSGTWYFSPVLAVRDDTGRVTGLRIGAGRARNILFRKIKNN
ncbi:MAG: beta-lactamase family protein [Cyclobacteriaceae bacterium]|nr:beta-lactamase family protein [Cyclobacteriaceae bacterium]